MNSRLSQALEALRQGPHNASTLAEVLGVTPRTAQRYVETLRKYGYALDYNPSRRCYRLTEPERSPFGGLVLSETERHALALASVFLRGHGGAFGQTAAALASLSERAGPLDGFPQEALSVHPGEAPEERTLRQLFSALMAQRTIHFHYRPLDGPEGSREVAPYHVFFKEGAWYLYALNLESRQTRFCRLSRIDEVEAGNRHFSYPSDLSIQKIFEETFFLYRGGKPQPVVLEVTHPMWARYILGVRWHASQRVLREEVPARVSFEVALSPELERWVLGFGEHVRVVSPVALAESIRSRHLKAAF